MERNISEVVKLYLNNFIHMESEIDIFNNQEIHFIENCITHKEERDIKCRDSWGNWDFPYTKYNYQEPYLDKFILNKLKENGIKQKQIWPNGAKFAINISHDVDIVTKIDYRQVKRSVKKNYKKQFFYRNASLISNSIKQILYNTNNDDLWCYEKWIELLNKNNFTSVFYYFNRPSDKNLHIYDCDYLLEDKVKYEGKKMFVYEMMQEMEKQGYEIGLHGSINTFDNAELLTEQKKGLEQFLKHPIISTRQHFLKYEISKTPTIHEIANIKIDSTLGFNRSIGFRAGTCFPYHLVNENLEKLNIIELPMIIMDGALFTSNALELNENLAINKCLDIINKVEEVGGCLTINFHPNYIIDKKWWNVFSYIISEVKSRNVHLLKLNEILS
jgi:hypothetical protein